MKTRATSVTFGIGFCLWFALHASAQTITIENAGREPFPYSVRLAKGGPWSGKHELGAKQRHRLTSSEPLVLSYWTDKPRFITLQPNGTYRIDDPNAGELRQVVQTLRPTLPDPGAASSALPGRAASDRRLATGASGAESTGPVTPQTVGPPPSVREVRVLAIADETCRKTVPDWQRRIRQVLQFVSDYYEARLAIRFVVHETRAWDYKALHQDLDERWDALLQQSPGEADLVVAFVGLGAYHVKAPGMVSLTGNAGRAAPFGQHILISVDVGVHPNRDKTILIHEIGHVFGAFHVAEKDAAMQPEYEKCPMEDIIQGKVDLGSAAREVVRLTRDFDFGRGVESLSADVQRRIRELHRTAGHPDEQTYGDPVAAGYAYREKRARLAWSQTDKHPGPDTPPPSGTETHRARDDSARSGPELPEMVDLLNQGKIEIQAEACGIRSVRVKIRRLVPYVVTLRISAGTYFVSRNSSRQNMVVTAETQCILATSDWTSLTSPAAGANRRRGIPTEKDTFAVQRSPDQAELVKLMPVLDSTNPAFPIRQAAVWILTDDANYADLGSLLTRGMSLGGLPLDGLNSPGTGERTIKASDVATAMKICEKAGIDITRKAIWRDRPRILQALDEGELKKWLNAGDAKRVSGQEAPNNDKTNDAKNALAKPEQALKDTVEKRLKVTPLQAAGTARKNKVERLLTADADVNANDAAGKTAPPQGLKQKTQEIANSIPYVDKNKYYQFTPPEGWVKAEFPDPRTKVSFNVPSLVPGRSKASLFFLSHPLSGDLDVRADAEDRVARLKQMGSPDANVTTVSFAGVTAEQVEGQMERQNMRMRVLMFSNYGRSYVISFTAAPQDFLQYWPAAQKALSTFKCLRPATVEVVTDAEKERIQKEQIRVWITGLKESDLATDAYSSLLAVGAPAIAQLEEAVRSGTPLQRQRASELLKRIRKVTTSGR